MTNRELKLELAKVALANGSNIETAKAFYNWITEEPERFVDTKSEPTPYDEIAIEELACRTRAQGTIINRCKDNDINTIGDLIRCGARQFSTYNLVGRSTINKIDDALERYYNIKDWYTT